MTTLPGDAEWRRGLLTPIPDGRYEIKGFATDEARGVAIVAAVFLAAVFLAAVFLRAVFLRAVFLRAVFLGAHAGEGGPMAPTGRSLATTNVYAIEFDGEKIRRMTKIWNNVPALRALGWA